MNVLFLGPGKSISNYDINILIGKYKYTASLNDMFLYYPTDFYFVGEKFIFDYVEQHCEKDKFAEAKKFILGINRDHATRIGLKYFKKIQKKWPNCHYVKALNSSELKKTTEKYDIPLIRKFSEKNMLVLRNLRYNVSQNASYYIRSRTLSNSLQILLGLGYNNVSLLGFMDSETFERNDYTHQKIYVERAKARFSIKSPKDVPLSHLRDSLQYQQQILRTIEKIFDIRCGKICTLCPKRINISGLPEYE